MSQQPEAARSLVELARCVDALLAEPAKREVAQKLVGRYLDDAAQEAVGNPGSICRTVWQPPADQDSPRPELATGLSLADRLPTDPNDPYDWSLSSLNEAIAPALTPEQTATALVALHATRCHGVESIVKVRAEFPEVALGAELPEDTLLADKRRAVRWAATLDSVERLGDYALHWFKLQFHRFEQLLTSITDNVNATPSPAVVPPMMRLLRVFTNRVIDDKIRQAAQILSNDNLSVNERLFKTDSLIPFPPTASAKQLGDMLDVTKQAVMKSDWWIQNRKGEKANEIGRRRAVHQRRAKEYESPDSDERDGER